MGFLHEGHLSLFRRACRETDFVVVSVFINPMQFGPHEDLDQYPRDFARDSVLCRRENVDLLFVPTVRALYPKGYGTFIEPGGLASVLCGKSRPGHFRGVATIVAKLLNLVQPTEAYFGQKDYQQVLVIKQLVKDLDFPVKVKICPTVRADDGLALSSRNRYLNGHARQRALCFAKALRWFRSEIRKGCRDIPFLKRGMRHILSQGLSRIDYAEILVARDLSPPQKLSGKIIVTLAGFVPLKQGHGFHGEVRLIDNCLLNVGSR